MVDGVIGKVREAWMRGKNKWKEGESETLLDFQRLTK